MQASYPPRSSTSTTRHDALVALGRELEAASYSFITVTPATHARVLARQTRGASSLRDVFGWNRAFEPNALPGRMLSLLRAADALHEAEGHPGQLRARVRFSTLGGALYAHSAFPTDERDAVFFGPDTYRFCRLLARWAPPMARRALDIGCGSGAGVLSIASRVRELVASDINRSALELAAVNAELAERDVSFYQGDLLREVPGEFDLIVSNPPYMQDSLARRYRDGGARWGAQVSLRIVEEALPRLAAGGTLILYTGSAIVQGRDTFRAGLEARLSERALEVEYEEIDPDVFGEALDEPAYAEVERIAAVGLRVRVS